MPAIAKDLREISASIKKTAGDSGCVFRVDDASIAITDTKPTIVGNSDGSSAAVDLGPSYVMRRKYAKRLAHDLMDAHAAAVALRDGPRH